MNTVRRRRNAHWTVIILRIRHANRLPLNQQIIYLSSPSLTHQVYQLCKICCSLIKGAIELKFIEAELMRFARNDKVQQLTGVTI